MSSQFDQARRSLLTGTAAAAGWWAATACSGSPPVAKAAASGSEEGEGEGVSTNEDLMREHGLLARLLLVYEAAIARPALDAAVTASVHHAADLIGSFIEQYHEKLEEDYIFPLLERAGRQTDLVRTLRAQHVAGRVVTQNILRVTAPGTVPQASELSHFVQAFVRMYRPHASREDTIIFPILHEVVSPKQLHELGERFEDIEHQRFGKGGFESVVAQAGELEKALGIDDIAQFTPA
jgi:hemerythrin-like domain-containing protein